MKVHAIQPGRPVGNAPSLRGEGLYPEAPARLTDLEPVDYLP